MGKVDIWSMAFQEVRKLINQLIMRVHADVPCVDAIEDCSVIGTTGHVPVRVYRMRHEGAQPAIMLIHGGAWVAGDLETHDNLARYLCVKSDAVVLSVGYTNAPEGKFPLPLEQCNDVLNWMVDQAAALGIDPARIAVAGDSAGGNLAAALCLLVRDRQGPPIALQVLINPALDLSCKGTLLRQHDVFDFMRWQVLQYLAKQYLTDPASLRHPYVSPLHAPDVTRLPPAVLIVAEFDFLREGGQQYAGRLLAAGVPTVLYCQPGVDHLAGDGARASKKAEPSLAVAVQELRKIFYGKEG